jgi:hypothetical protein
MRKRLLPVLALLAATMAFAGPTAAITGNATEDFVHDYVGLLVFYTDDDPMTADHDPFSHRCSGSLISSTVIVTAGHCTEGVDFGRAYFLQAVGPNYSPDSFGGFGGDETTGYPYLQGHTFSVADNYGFDGFATYPDTHDAGVVVLDEPYTPPSGTFGILPTNGLVDSLIAASGSSGKKDIRFRTVGYGLLDQDPVPNPGQRERMTAVGYLIEGSSGVTEFNLKTTANPSNGKGGSCNGDSGGPVLVDGTNILAGVVSFGMNPQCKGQDYSYRLDRTPVLNWINDPNRVDAG